LSKSEEVKNNRVKIIEEWMKEEIKNEQKGNRNRVYAEALRKIGNVEPRLKNIMSEISAGIERESRDNEISEQNTINERHDINLLTSQINELKNSLNELNREKNNFKKNIEQLNSILNYMKKKGVAVEQHFQQYFDEMKKKKEGKAKKVKNNDEKVKKSIPKLSMGQVGGVGFHQEFMAKVDEFSDSWRELIRNEKSIE
jgi:ribosomal protein S15P/S13E